MHGVDNKGVVLRRRLQRDEVAPFFFANLPACVVGLEACGGAHHWARRLQPPVVGKFEGNIGIFEGPDTFNGTPILVRFTWTVNPKASQARAKWEQTLNPKGLPVVAKWEQAFSKDNGKTWETNWYNEFIHDDNCTPTP